MSFLLHKCYNYFKISILYGFLHLLSSYFASTLPLLCLYLASTLSLFAVYGRLRLGCRQRSMGLAQYSHLGNKMFPAWEHNIPTLGISSQATSHSQCNKAALFSNNLPLLMNNLPLLIGNLPVSANKPALNPIDVK